MAERRMFAKSVIDSDVFLDMPATTQVLYFHLAMRADDDGFVSNPKRIERMVGCSDDDLNLLILKKFIIPFDSGIVVIKHWKIHNYIQKDRYKETAYKEEKALLSLDENNTYTLENDSCIQNGYSLDTQVRLGKDRLGKSKDRIELEEDSEPDGSAPTPSKPATIRHKYGEYKHVLLTDEQHSKLVEDFGESRIKDYIKRVDEYCEQYGKSYKNYSLTIRNWLNKDGVKDDRRNYSPSEDDVPRGSGVVI